MKQFLIFCLAIVSVVVHGQIKKDTSGRIPGLQVTPIINQPKSDTFKIKCYTDHHHPQPAVFIDSVRVDLNKTRILTANIEKIDVASGYEDTVNKTYGRVYIKLKSNIHFLTLNDITTKYGQNKIGKNSILYVIDKEVITDTSNVRIDADFIRNVEVTNIKEVKYLKNNYSKMIVLSITTGSKPDPKDIQIRIRGEVTAKRNE